MASTNLLAGEADRDARLGFAMKMAALQHEMDQRSTLLNILTQMRQERAAKKAAQKKSGGWGGLVGAGGGALAGLVLPPFTEGGSLLMNAAIGGGLGGSIGSSVDEAMGNRGSDLGRNLMDFSTGFGRLQGMNGGPQRDFSPYYFEPYPDAGGDLSGGFKDDWMR